MKSYLVRNRTSDTLTMQDLLEDASLGYWVLRGYQRTNDSEELFNALAHDIVFEGHTETVVRILEKHEKGKGVYVEKGLREGISPRFTIRIISSPRHIWSEKPIANLEEDQDENNLED